MLTTAKAPLRVSFFGGGTDYPSYFNQYQGAVLGTAIDKFVYIITLPMVGYAENRFRITYRTVEAVDHIDDIKHNAIRAVLKVLDYESPLNIATLSDLPGNSGLGSSSTFTVAFIKMIEFLKGREISKFDLMRAAVRIELDVLKENVGIQDQAHAAYGGLNLYTFKGRNFAIHPVQMSTEGRDALNTSFCLVYTGIQRSASQVLEEQMKNVAEKTIHKELDHLVQLCHAGVAILESARTETMLNEFGKLLSEGWETKRRLSSTISNSAIDEIYAEGMRAGAYGGKLCGAGAGGFFMFLAPEPAQERLKSMFGSKNFVKIRSVDDGASIRLS